MASRIADIVTRLSVGGSSYMTAIGGVVSLVAWGITIALAMIGHHAAEMAICIVVGILSGVVVIYDCGDRILKSEEKLKKDAELGIFLGMILTKITEIESLPVHQYYAQLSSDGSDSRMDAVLWYIKQRLPLCVGQANTALFYDMTGLVLTPVDPRNPFSTHEAFRQKNLDILKYSAARLGEIIRRLT